MPTLRLQVLGVVGISTAVYYNSPVPVRDKQLGLLSPLDGIGPKDLKIDDLARRIKKGGIKEVTLATDSNTEGEATTLYLIRLLKPLGVRLFRIAYGMPVGANLEYADQATLHKAFEGKKEV